MDIRILLVNSFLYTLCLVGCLGGNLYGQQKSGTINNEIMLLQKQWVKWQDSIDGATFFCHPAISAIEKSFKLFFSCLTKK